MAKCKMTREPSTLQFNTGCQNEITDDDYDFIFEFVFCPFCGKEIEFSEDIIQEHRRFYDG